MASTDPASSQGSKRASTQAAKEPTAKQARKQADEVMPPAALSFLKKSGITAASIEPVCEVVRHAQSGVPQEVRDMLLAALPWTLAVPADKRNGSQQDAVLMVDGVFQSVQAALQGALEAAVGSIEDLKTEEVELADRAERAEAASTVARSTAEERQKALAQASCALVEARKATQAAEREEARLGAESSGARLLVKELEEVLSDSFRRLKGLDFEEGEAKRLIQTVMAAGAKSDMEEALVATVPLCLAKRERGPFDQTVISGAEQCIQAKVAALHQELAAASVPAGAQAEAAREAKAAGEAAVADQARAAQRLCSAQAEAREAAAGVEAAKVAVAAFGTKLAPAVEVQSERQVDLDHFRSHNLSLFQTLRDRQTESSKPEKVVSEDVAKEEPASATGADGAVLPASLAGA